LMLSTEHRARMRSSLRADFCVAVGILTPEWPALKTSLKRPGGRRPGQISPSGRRLPRW